jgi:hypothetical protein
MMRYAEDRFSTSLLSTAGVDYQTQFLEVDGKRVKCQVRVPLIVLRRARVP